MIFGLSLYQIGLYFLIYSFAGWVVEVIYSAVKHGKIVNRGFLNGPVCPIYGFGMIIVLALVRSLPHDSLGEVSSVWLFFVGGGLATLVELIAGFAMDKLFHSQWWSYADKPFNFHGYICLEFSIIWGLAAVLVVKGIHPIIHQTVRWSYNSKLGWGIMIILYAVYLVDFIVTIMTVRGMNKDLAKIDSISKALLTSSDKMSRFIATNAMQAETSFDEGRVRSALGRAELRDKMAAYYDKANRHSLFSERRLIKAFPDLQHRQYDDALDKVKRSIRATDQANAKK